MEHSDIGPIRVSGSTQYILEVSMLLGKIKSWQVGRAVIEKIRAHGRLVIIPYPWQIAITAGVFNAVHTSRFDEPVLDGPHVKTETTVAFSPETFAAMRSVNGVPLPNWAALKPGALAEDILVHEMVHAGRWLGHDSNHTELKGRMVGYDNPEEFVAILIANIYVSEKGWPASDLRYDHWGFDRLPDRMNTSETFLNADDNYKWIDDFCRKQPKISRMIEKAPAKFNPVRAYYEQNRVHIPSAEGGGPSYRVAQKDAAPRLTDEYLAGLLKPRFAAGDVAGYGGRVRELERVFGSLSPAEATPLLSRLASNPRADAVAGYFNANLSTATRFSLMEILRRRMYA